MFARSSLRLASYWAIVVPPFLTSRSSIGPSPQAGGVGWRPVRAVRSVIAVVGVPGATT